MKVLSVQRDSTNTFHHRTRVELPIDATKHTTSDDIHIAVNGDIDIYMVWPDVDEDDPKVCSINRYRRPTLIGTFKPEAIGHFPERRCAWSLTGMLCYHHAGFFDESKLARMELIPIFAFVDPANIRLGSKIIKFGHIVAEATIPEKG
jgi:hypothetical protein